MAGRRLVWSNPRVQEAAKEYVVVGIDPSTYLEDASPVGSFFRKFTEQAWLIPLVDIGETRQGIYAIAPSGVLLAQAQDDVFAGPALAALDAMRRGLKAWERLSEEERYLAEPEGFAEEEREAGDFAFPEEGLVLYESLRDLPRKDPTPAEIEDMKQFAAHTWNQDTVWYRKDEARRFLPADPKPGERYAVPEPLVMRLATCHLVDSIRNLVLPFEAKDVETARLDGTVLTVEEGEVTARLSGRVRTVCRGVWTVGDFAEDPPRPHTRGIDVEILGYLRYDTRAGRFTRFDVAAVGTRWGGITSNGRYNNLNPTPIGFAFAIKEVKHWTDRFAPSRIYGYVWE